MKNSIYNILIERQKNRSLVFNTYSGAVAWLEDDYVNNKQNLNKLSQLGYMVEDDEDEIQKVLKECKSAIYESSPKKIKIVIAPTLLCNIMAHFSRQIADRFLMNQLTATIVEEYSLRVTGYAASLAASNSIAG